MKWGLTESDLQIIRGLLSQRREIQRAIIFGSRAKGNHKAGSDIDLALFGKNIDSKFLANLSECFYETDLPYTVDICDFSSLTHEDLKKHITECGEVLFERSQLN